ncbi:MAG: winged helix-turn-helix transcriptional regulator [Candidatus Hodarchaeales archaeon]
MKFNSREFEILLALRSNPFTSHKKLAEDLKMSWITVKKYYDNLVDKGIIQKKIAIYNPWKLGLIRVNILAFVKNHFNLRLLEKACDEHPYTQYRSRFVAGQFGLFIKFDLPKESIKLLIEFLDSLVTCDVITHYEYTINNGLHFETTPDISRYNSDEDKWDFSWTDWFNKIPTHSSDTIILKNKPVDLSKIKPSHLKILRKLTENADIKQAKLRKELGLTRSEMSRQFQFVKDELVQSSRLLFDLNAFNLSETYLIKCDSVSKKIQGQFVYAFKNDPPPFHSMLEILEDNSIEIWSNLPSSQAQEMVYSCWSMLENAKTFVLNTGGKASMRYWFYDENFDFDQHYWKTSKDYIVIEPLNRLFQSN